MKKYLPVLIVILLIAAIALLTNKGPSDSSPIVLGFTSALSGDAASWGEPVRRGAEIAVEEANSEGGINGRKIELVVEDDKCDPKEGVSALQRLLLKKPSAVLGTVCSSPTIAMLPITEENKLVFVSAAASSPKLTEMGDYFFRVYPSDSYPVSVAGRHAVEKMNLQTFATLVINNEYGEGLEKSFVTAVKEVGGSVVVSDRFPLNATDFKTQLTKVKAQNPEALFIGSNPKEFPLIIKQIRELGILSILLADSPTVESTEGKEVWGIIDTLYYTVPIESSTDVSRRLKETYLKKFGKDPEILTDSGYDSVAVVIEAIKNVGTDSEEIKQHLYQLKNYQTAGGILSFDRNGDVQKPFQIKEIKNGQANVVSQ